MVNSKADAERAIKACKYPPLGERGIGFSRANQYGFALQEYMEKVLKAAKRAGVTAGIHVVSPSVKDVYQRYEEGFRFIALSLDITVLGHYFRKMVEELRPITGKT
jgi:2-keto-3-deoxy-L-rhamnonate aldolase RhmA